MSGLQLAVNSADHRQGNFDAPITLVEYGDFQCPYCRRAHPLVKRLLQERGHEISFVFRNFPLRKIHPLAFISAVTAEAAGKQGKFWQMHDLIFENQNKLTKNYLLSLVENIGLDSWQFALDSQSGEIVKKIEIDFESGILSGVNGTPTFFLNGNILRNYDETYESLINPILYETQSMLNRQQ